jgi:hypothetical protein
MIEGSGSGFIPLTNGSGSRKPKTCGSRSGFGSATPLVTKIRDFNKEDLILSRTKILRECCVCTGQLFIRHKKDRLTDDVSTWLDSKQ